MGCAYSCRRQEVAGLSLSWGCCRHRCCFCGMCSVVHPFSGKRDATSSLRSVSVPPSTGLLDITPGGALFPGASCAPTNVQDNEHLGLANSCTNRASVEGRPGSLGIFGDGGEVPLISPDQIKEQFFQKEKETLHVANKKSRGFGSIESILILPEDEDNCPICLEEYDKENPRIDTICEHHYHLCCILEWMERSDNCPMCDKEVVLYESL